MRADTLTKLPLYRWFRLIGVHPSHSAGIFFSNSPTLCQMPWLQHSYQSVDRVGRDEVAMAIAQAEADIERFLGYRLLPSWEVDEWRPTERPYKPELLNLNAIDVRGFAQTVQARWGHFITGGIRSKELLAADTPIVYSDLDGDAYKEKATVTVAVAAGTDPCEIHVYYPASNVLVGTGGLDDWEIRPVSVSVVGAVATITFRRDQCVLPDRWEDYFPPADDTHLRGVDGAVDANFLDEVDVYRVYNDPQTQVSFLWEPFGSGCGCQDAGCTMCAYSAQTGCLMVRNDPRLSLVSYRPGSWDATTLSFTSESWAEGRQPDIARLYYYAGLRDKGKLCSTIQMNGDWERTVAYYAAALLDRPICECNNIQAWVDHWQRDLAIAGEEGLQVSAADLDNPFGTRRGAVYAWRRVKQEALGGAANA